MRGRKPVSPELKLLHGARPGGRRQKVVHKIPVLTDQAADWLSREDGELYGQLVRDAPAGLLATIDRPMLELFVIHAGLVRRARTELDQLTVNIDGVERKHPLTQLLVDELRLLPRLADQLGLSITARQRIRLAPIVDHGSWADIAGPAAT